jgi:hypothetical protein
MEINIENKGEENLKAPIPNTDYDQFKKKNENVEYFDYWGSMITNDARCTYKIQNRIAMATAAFNKQTLLTGNWA